MEDRVDMGEDYWWGLEELERLERLGDWSNWKNWGRGLNLVRTMKCGKFEAVKEM